MCFLNVLLLSGLITANEQKNNFTIDFREINPVPLSIINLEFTNASSNGLPITEMLIMFNFLKSNQNLGFGSNVVQLLEPLVELFGFSMKNIRHKCIHLDTNVSFGIVQADT